MLCAGPLTRGRQGWREVEEEGQGGALTVRRHPNPITDCCHSAAGSEGWTDRREREGEVNGNRKDEKSTRQEEQEAQKSKTCAEREGEKTKETSLSSAEVKGKCYIIGKQSSLKPAIQKTLYVHLLAHTMVKCLTYELLSQRIQTLLLVREPNLVTFCLWHI